jgi:hypothetical protein
VADWNATGTPVALVPGLSGGWLIDLETGAARRLPMPIYSEYRSWEPYLPAPIWKWLIQETLWPTLARADDNGDGRPDLFALSRWSIWIYHAGPEGLPSAPSRKIDLVPFDEETERRHEATAHTYFAHDFDRNGYADLLLSTVGGGLMKGRSTTKIYRAGSQGVTLARPPDALLETQGGFSHVHFEDLDGDGRDELLETTIEFGLVQLMRVLVTRRAETQIRVRTLDAEAPGGTRVLFEDELTFRLNFSDGNVSGLIPSLGDWNGDGVRDLYVARGTKEIAFRLGSKSPGEPLFGRATGTQPVPLESGESRVADLDGDGLDEIVAFDLMDPDAPLIVLHNRGRLPGTRPELRAPRRPGQPPP